MPETKPRDLCRAGSHVFDERPVPDVASLEYPHPRDDVDGSHCKPSSEHQLKIEPRPLQIYSQE